MPNHPVDWSALALSADPILAVGWRPRPKQLDAATVDLHAETFDTMRDISNATLAAIRDRQPVPWHPNAFMEENEEYLLFEHGAHQEVAALVRLVMLPSQLGRVTLSDLRDLPMRFYAILWEDGLQGDPVAFVSQYDPTVMLRQAVSFFRFQGTLRSAEPPDFTLNRRADMIITRTHVAILRTVAFNRLFSDIRAALNDVKTSVTKLRAVMTGLPMTAASATAFETVCATRPTFADRLQRLSEDTALVSQLTPRSVRAALRRHQRSSSEFLSGAQLAITDAQVSTFLDIAEGRLFEADFTGEGRRAARWSAT